jgi:hypothetical protein
MHRLGNRKGLQVTKSVEASPPLRGRRFERAVLSFRNALETQRSFATVK